MRFLFVGLLMGFSLFAHAQEINPFANPNVAIINLQDMERQSLAWRALRQQLGERRELFQSDIRTREEDLRTKQQELQTERALLSDEAFAQKEREFRDQVQMLNRLAQTRKQELDQAYLLARREIESTIAKIIREIAAQNDITLILNANNQDATVAFFVGRINITARAIEALNAQLPDVKLSDGTSAAADVQTGN